MTTTAVIVQARLGSTRLPAKVLLPLPTVPGRTVLEEVLYRCRLIPGVDVVVLATPDTAENDILASFWDGIIVRGPEHDVLARYAKAAGAVGADVVMRVTSDCPLIDPEVCGQVLDLFHKEKVDYCSNVLPRRFPQGLDCEVFTADALRRENERPSSPDAREHVTRGMQDGAYAKANLGHPQFRAPLRWTLDTLEDYVRIWGIFEQQMREAA